MEWYTYYGKGDVSDPLNYFFPNQYPNCPQGRKKICSIRAFRQYINGKPKPIITAMLQSEIASALYSKKESANVLLRAKQ